MAPRHDPPLAPLSSWLAAAGCWLKAHAGLLAVLAFATWFLSPLLASGYYGDDVLNSCVRGYLLSREESLWQFTAHYIGYHLRQGRIFPGALATTYTVHYLFPATLEYKSLLLGLVLSNLVAFYGLLRCWSLPRVAAQAGTLAVVLLVQLRITADPVLSFAGLLQILTGLLLTSLICWRKYLDSRGRGWLAASLILYAAALLTYEISYALLPVYVAMAWWHCRQWRPALRLARAHALTFGVSVVLILGLRCCYRPDSPTYRPNLAPVPIVATTLRQASSALPLSYALLSTHRPQVFSATRLVTRGDNWAIAAACGALCCALLVNLTRRQCVASTGIGPAAGPPLGLLATCGGLMWVLPGAVIAVSPTYQQLVETGLGYLPVYLQYFGCASVGLAATLWLADRGGRWVAAGIVPLSIVVAMTTFDVNRQVVDIFESNPAVGERRLLEAALDAGLADQVPAGATILTTRLHAFLGDGPPESSGFFSKHLRRKVHAVNGQVLPGLRTLTQQLAGIPSPSVALADACQPGGGYVVLSPLDERRQEGATANQSAGRVRVYVRGTLARSVPPALGENSNSWRLERQGQDWAIYVGRNDAVVNVADADPGRRLFGF